MTVAVARAQNPPMTTPRRALAAMRTAKFGAMAMSTSEASITPVRPTRTYRLSKRAANVAMNRLVATAKRPETEIACPAMPTVAPRSWAIGVRRLTGMNSAAMRRATHIAIDPTAPQVLASTEDASRSPERRVASGHVVAGRVSIRFVCIEYSVEDDGAVRPRGRQPAESTAIRSNASMPDERGGGSQRGLLVCSIHLRPNAPGREGTFLRSF